MFKKILKLCLSIGFALAVFLSIYSFTVIAHTPKINPDKIYDYLSERSVLLDDNGKVIDSVALIGANRTNVDYKDMSPHMVNAVVAIEDKTFWTHNGFNIWRMFGAIKEGITSGGHISGTSTITQQLARNVYLSETKSVRSLSRKISEAYYTVVLESSLSKEKIMEAYLNTIYLGNNSYGIQSAARSYFNKDAKDLDILEAASLAALPKAPDSYALVKKISASESKTGEFSDKKVLHENSDYVYFYNGDASKDRRDMILSLMLKNKTISQEDYDKYSKESLEDKLDIAVTVAPDSDSYFLDYVLDNVVEDLMKKYNYTREEATEKIYAGGLTIHTTMNTKAQNAITSAFSDASNFPGISSINYDGNDNIIGENGQVLLYPFTSYFDENDSFTLSSDEYVEKDGNLVLLKDKRLNFFNTTVNGKTDYSVEFKDMYKKKDGVLYTIKGGFILIPQQYKSLDSDGNLIIDKSFWDDKDLHSSGSTFFKKSGSDYIVGKEYYKLNPTIRQPQAAMTIVDYKTGQLKAMVGGREITGRQLYNRAINPRQPGSSIKPLSVYSSALQQGKEAADKNTPMHFTEFDANQKTEIYGDYWTAASGINDAPIKLNGKDWPRNWYNSYNGPVSFRKAVEQSVNTTAVRVYQQVGPSYAIDQLKKFGVTTVDEEGDTNDKNPSALALGGMSRGISPLEMSSAFGVFPNGGKRVDVTCYTKVVDKQGEVILETKPEKTTVLDEGVAFIMQDILVSTVEKGIASSGRVYGQRTGGKTGTTTDEMDVWFVGFTPQYSAAIWIGSDVNIMIDGTSMGAARLWAKIMSAATSGMGGSLPSAPSNVVSVNGEYFINGTQTGVRFNSEAEEEKKKKKEEEEKKKKEEEEKKKKEEEEKKKAEEEAQSENENNNQNQQNQQNPQNPQPVDP